MNDEDLKKLWREQPLQIPQTHESVDTTDAFRLKMKKFDRTIFWRDVRELIACAVVALAFGLFLFSVKPMMARVGCAITIAGAAFIAWRLVSSKRKAGPEIADAPVLQALRREKLKVEIQIGLLRSVWWWYLLPVLGGATIFAFGMQPDAKKRMILGGTFLFVGVVIHWVNQLAVRKYLEPLKNELETLIGNASETDKNT